MAHHRLPAARDDAPPARATRNRDLTVPLLLFALGAARVVVGVEHHETFGAEATIALFAALFAAAALARGWQA